MILSFYRKLRACPISSRSAVNACKRSQFARIFVKYVQYAPQIRENLPSFSHICNQPLTFRAAFEACNRLFMCIRWNNQPGGVSTSSTQEASEGTIYPPWLQTLVCFELSLLSIKVSRLIGTDQSIDFLLMAFEPE